MLPLSLLALTNDSPELPGPIGPPLRDDFPTLQLAHPLPKETVASQDGVVRVAVIDDDPGILALLRRALRGRGLEPVSFSEPIAALAAIERDPELAAVLLDVGLPGMSGLDVLAHLKESRPSIEVIMMTADDTAKTAVRALKLGAYDYLTKPFADIETVMASVARATERHALVERATRLERLVDVNERFPGFVTRSAGLRQALALVEQVASTDATVLLRGESGVGKELVARLLHTRSERKRGPFLPVTCSGLPEGLLDSELFGHARGAFTGASGVRRGVFEEASGGTLFLDEIGDAPVATQLKLLRALQEREIRPLGVSVAKKVDVRIVAATNVDLEAAIARGTFREDLFFRLNVFTIELPPLRDRMEDVPALVQTFVAKYAERHRRPVTRVAGAAMELLLHHDWPGNVRELEHAIERAIIVARGEEIEPSCLPPLLAGRRHPPPAQRTEPRGLASGGRSDGLLDLPFANAKTLATESFERSYAEHVLATQDGNLSAAARAAGLDRSNFRRLLARHGLIDRRR